LTDLQSVPSFNRAGVLDFLRTGVRIGVFPAPVTENAEWFLGLFPPKSLQRDHEIIFSMFLPRLGLKKRGFLAALVKVLASFIQQFSCPFLFPGEPIRASGLQFSGGDIVNYSSDVLACCFQTIADCLECVRDPPSFCGPLLGPFADDGRDVGDFTRADREPNLFRRVWFWKLGVRSLPDFARPSKST
jgi:hypothetical protein